MLVGNMVNYTPGSHLLAAMAGAWIRQRRAARGVSPRGAVGRDQGWPGVSDRPASPGRARGAGSGGLAPIALGGVLLLFLPYDYFIGSFARFSFFAQVVSEMFAVAMWLALVLWHERPSLQAAAIFGIAGVGVFLTWPVWVGPPFLVLLVLAAGESRRAPSRHWRYVAYAPRPHRHRGGAARARTRRVGGDRADGRRRIRADRVAGSAGRSWCSPASGAVVAAWHRSSRVTPLLLAAVALQTLALLVVARVSAADSPYMALKMPHFAIYPMAAAAALAISGAFQTLAQVAARAVPEGWLKRHGMDVLAWVLVVACGAVTGARFVSMPRPVPAITEDMYRAGRWARDHVQPDCIEYLVPQDSTSYWLHQAVLGNPMQPAPGAAPPVFVYRDALVRWITGTSFPVAIADLSVIPREVREDLDVLARFGDVAVGRRRGTTACPGR